MEGSCRKDIGEEELKIPVNMPKAKKKKNVRHL